MDVGPLVNVTGSAKIGHNHTSLNLQYKALNTFGAYLRITEKKFRAFFLVKEGPTNKNLVFVSSRRVGKSFFFIAIGPRVCKLWAFINFSS